MSNIFKCGICGNTLTKVFDGGGQLVCCDQNMTNLQAKNSEEGLEKHKPVIEKVDCGIKVKVGSIEHPSTDEHFIMLIQILKNNSVIAGKQLKPNELPEAVFNIPFDEDIKCRALCNIHGLWESD